MILRISIIISIAIQLLFAEVRESCILEKTRDYNRITYAQHEIIESIHFRIHFTVAEDDSILHSGVWLNPQTNLTYAISVLEQFEHSANVYLQKGWPMPPPDCEEFITDETDVSHCINFGGDSRYDIYLTPHGPGFTIPDQSYNVEPYTAARTSYIFLSTMSNMHEIYPSWGYYAIAHELHHAIQFGFAYSSTGSPGQSISNGWFFDSELLVIAQKNGFKIKAVPVKWIDDPSSSVNVLKTAIEDLIGLIRIRINIK